MDVRQTIDDFLASGPYAVVGASRDRNKYGNKVLRCYLQHGLEVYPVNPNSPQVEGLECYPDLRSLPRSVRGVSVITPPEITERIIEAVPDAGASFVWMQPGAESEAAISRAEGLDVRVIARGPCLLVALGFREDRD